MKTISFSFSLKWILLLSLLGADGKQGGKKFYDPVIKKVEGWTIEYDPALFTKEKDKFRNDVTKALANHLQRIIYILPTEKVKVLRKLPIRLDLKHKLGNMQYHPAKGWLIKHGYDPRMEKRVHIPRAQALLDRQTWAKHPYVILHELAHAYHDQVLSFDNKEIIKVYQASEKKGLYERVLLFTGRKVKHYARTNHKEFFAEMTESYLGVNDFYPFVRAELKEYDPETYELMRKIWGDI